MLQNRRRPSLIVKLNFLLLGLGLTLYGMYGVNLHGLPAPLLSVLGLQSPAGEKMCKTRVQGVIQPDKLKLMQEGNEWLADGSSPGSPGHKVNFIAVEKWLSHFCSAKLESVATSSKADAGAGFTPALFVKFIDGGIDVLRSGAGNQFEWHGKVYRSDDLKKTLDELNTLPEAQNTQTAN